MKKVFGTCKELEETVRGMMPNWDLIMLTSSTGTFPFGGNAQVSDAERVELV